MHTSVEPVENIYKADCNDLDIGMFEWARTDRYTTRLGTMGLATCLGVAAYDEATKVAHLAHFVSVEPADIGANAFFDSVADSLGNEFSTSVWLRGGNAELCGGTCEDGCKKTPDTALCSGVLDSRDAIVSALRQRGIVEAQMDVQWNEVKDIWVCMNINSITGDCNTTDFWAPTRRALPFRR